MLTSCACLGCASLLQTQQSRAPIPSAVLWGKGRGTTAGRGRNGVHALPLYGWVLWRRTPPFSTGGAAHAVCISGPKPAAAELSHLVSFVWLAAAFPRLVKHVDDGFLAQVTQLYRERIQPGSVVLDLMSSWVSHLPPEVKYEKVIGHGLNAAELARNKQMDSFFVRDLNAEPDGWAMGDQSVDAVVCCVSVQYMQQPERVFAEVYRVLKPGGVFILTFSNRMFYDKAIAAWREGTGYSRCQLVKQYFQAVQGYTDPEVVQQVPLPAGQQQGSGLLQLMPKQLQQFFARTSSDPFYAVLAYRNFKPDYS
eukprot:GHRQ01012055.1.p1 GENE.GHRQ01012055.1~~GHRQ01012055.1.p1  ORF type:complete len:309 (+),score=84.59 GHRQ01012055.1:629-1555(+)